MSDDLGAKIRKLRKRHGLKLADLAERANISTSYLSQLERGEKDGVSADILFRLANSLNTTMASLLRKDEPKKELVAGEEIPPALNSFYENRKDDLGISETDLVMLAGIRYRGHQPKTEDDWEFLYLTIRRTVE